MATQLAVAITVESLTQAHAAAARAAEQGADLVEYRVDRFTDDLAAIAKLVEDSPLPCIFTCRPTWEGGAFEGTDSDRLPVFEAAVNAARPPAYVDIELKSSLRDQFDVSGPGLILSSHDFVGRPGDLYQRIEAMAADNRCRVAKVAWRARSLRDNLEAFEIVHQRTKPTIALCMDELGLPSRVLARKFGALLTFAALDAQAGTAPGQPTAQDLKNLYRWDAINSRTKVFGVIGYPIAHSMSPAIHNAGFTETGFDGVYLPMPIPPEYEHFKATVATWLAMDELHFYGASVTIPHKQNLLRFVREAGGDIDPLAERIGAANTLSRRPDGSLLVTNTDCPAALNAVCVSLGITRDDLAAKRVAVIGAGGAARAIIAGFAVNGSTIVIYNRTFEKAQALAAEFADFDAKVVPAKLDKLCDSCYHIFINCTSVGMHPNVDATPVPNAPNWGPDTVVFDTIYNPLETRLLRDAQAAGCKTISGLEMFTRQAALQFTQWTGLDAPMQLFHDVVEQHLR
jgi:3-dehydroquinate dehydratase/shikimate dehydrogenase